MCRIYMRNATVDEAQTRIKIVGRSNNNLRYADDTTLMAESKEEKAGLKLNIQKMKIMASSPITLWQTDGEKMEAVTDFVFLRSKITEDSDCSHEIKRHLLLGRKVMTNHSFDYTDLCWQSDISPF